MASDSKNNVPAPKQHLMDQMEYAKYMRMKLSKPDCIDADGNLNYEYFRPKVLDHISWTEETILDLANGIKMHGVGKWSQIQADFLPMLAPLDIRIKVMKLLGMQNLSKYEGWKGDLQAMRIEFEKNKSEALSRGLWKYDIFLDDAFGDALEQKKSK